ncbi:hypothetical protein THAOC_37021, partial [Thalassiosira oceanica]
MSLRLPERVARFSIRRRLKRILALRMIKKEDAKILRAAEEDATIDTDVEVPTSLEDALPSDKKLRDTDQRAIVVTEMTGSFNMIGCNKAWENLCGYAECEIRGKDSSILQTEDTNYLGLREAVQRLFEEEAPQRVVSTNKRKDGSKFKNLMKMGPIFDSTGKMTHCVAILTNVDKSNDKSSDKSTNKKCEKRNAAKKKTGSKMRKLSSQFSKPTFKQQSMLNPQMPHLIKLTRHSEIAMTIKSMRHVIRFTYDQDQNKEASEARMAGERGAQERRHRTTGHTRKTDGRTAQETAGASRLSRRLSSNDVGGGLPLRCLKGRRTAMPRTIFHNRRDRNRVGQYSRSKRASMTRLVPCSNGANYPFTAGDDDMLRMYIEDYQTNCVEASSTTCASALEYGYPINCWQVQAITNFRQLFSGSGLSNFNEDISAWDVSSVTNFDGTFSQAAHFNQPIGAWNVSSGVSFENMFHNTHFNQPLNDWDVSQ